MWAAKTCWATSVTVSEGCRSSWIIRIGSTRSRDSRIFRSLKPEAPSRRQAVGEMVDADQDRRCREHVTSIGQIEKSSIRKSRDMRPFQYGDRLLASAQNKVRGG